MNLEKFLKYKDVKTINISQDVDETHYFNYTQRIWKNYKDVSIKFINGEIIEFSYYDNEMEEQILQVIINNSISLQRALKIKNLKQKFDERRK